jgi:hypothetical protein
LIGSDILSGEVWTFCPGLLRGPSQLIDFLHRAIWHMDCSLLFNKSKGRNDDLRCAAEVSCWPGMSCRQNLTSIERHGCEHNQDIRVDSRMRVAIPARSGTAWNSGWGCSTALKTGSGR